MTEDEIERAFDAFRVVAREVAALDKAKWTEADTRLKVIDKIVFDVLGWDKDEANVEERAGSGYADYTLKTRNIARLIIEAKKDAAVFELQSRQAARAYILDGPVFNSTAKQAIEQSVVYCAFKNCELACATNGAEWIVFRANRLGDGLDTLKGKGFVFPSIKDIETNFRIFFDLLSKSAVNSLRYRAEFQKAEGLPVRDLSFLKCPCNPMSKRLVFRDKFAADFDAVMSSFFERLKGDQDADMIQKCFVVTPESHLADQKLSRIAEDLVEKIRTLDSGTGYELVELLEAAKLQHKNRFILLVGNKGAGKSTFIDRFFNFVLPRKTADDIVTLRVDLSLNSGEDSTVVPWLNQKLLQECENAVFSGDSPAEWNDYVGKMFFDDYQRWSAGTMSHLYNDDRTALGVALLERRFSSNLIMRLAEFHNGSRVDAHARVLCETPNRRPSRRLNGVSEVL